MTNNPKSKSWLTRTFNNIGLLCYKSNNNPIEVDNIKEQIENDIMTMENETDNDIKSCKYLSTPTLTTDKKGNACIVYTTEDIQRGKEFIENVTKVTAPSKKIMDSVYFTNVDDRKTNIEPTGKFDEEDTEHIIFGNTEIKQEIDISTERNYEEYNNKYKK
jgi:hypothetical protein